LASAGPTRSRTGVSNTIPAKRTASPASSVVLPLPSASSSFRLQAAGVRACTASVAFGSPEESSPDSMQSPQWNSAVGVTHESDHEWAPSLLESQLPSVSVFGFLPAKLLPMLQHLCWKFSSISAGGDLALQSHFLSGKEGTRSGELLLERQLILTRC
jgi:hypothetical protein